MSMVPLRFRDWWDDFDRPISRLTDQHFGRGWFRDDLCSRLSSWRLREPTSVFGSAYYRPWRNFSTSDLGGVSTIANDQDKFQVILDVQQFAPEEITVKTVGNSVIVEAEHEERQDEHGFISRRFVRRYVLPTSHDLANVTSTLSSDGILTISAPKKIENPAGTERVINIVQTGTPAEQKKETIITTETTDSTNKTE